MFALPAGMGIVAFLALAVGAIFAVNLLGGEPQANQESDPAENPPPEAEALPETVSETFEERFGMDGSDETDGMDAEGAESLADPAKAIFELSAAPIRTSG